MKLSSMVLGMLFAVAVIAGLMLIFGFHFQTPMPAQGEALYNPANETTVKGVVKEAPEFACPVSEGEIGSHLVLETTDGPVQIHLAPARVMRSQKLNFAIGDKIEVVGSKVRYNGKADIIAREIIRGSETITLRDPQGKMLLTQ